MGTFDQVEKFTQACSSTFRSPALEQSACHAAVFPWSGHDGIEQRSVSAEPVAINCRPRVDVSASREQPIEDLALSETNRKVQQCVAAG
jgi:hypothetical protein